MSSHCITTLTRATSSLGILILTSACSPPTSEADSRYGTHPNSAHVSGAATAGETVRFQEGVGLWLPEATQVALMIRTSEVDERPVAALYQVSAQIFTAGPPCQASVRLPVAEAAHLSGKDPAGARWLRLDRGLESANGDAELVYALEETYPVGTFVELVLEDSPIAPVPSIPREAVLRSTAGAFVYVINGPAFLRTPVTLGAIGAERVEIRDGLYVGDTVVVHPVEQLWLAELRLTKGGSHCH